MQDTPGTDERLKLLEQELEARQATIHRIRTLLSRADERRSASPAESRRWSSILTNLERTLEEAKAQLAECQVRLDYARERAHFNAQIDTVISSVARDDASLPAHAPELHDSGINRAIQHVASAELHELEGVTLEEAAMVQAALNNQPVQEALAGRNATLASKLEFANQTRRRDAIVKQSGGAGNFRTQLALRAAVDKIVAGKLKSVTLDEFDLILGCYIVLQRRIDPDDADLRLKDILEKALMLFDEKFQALRNKMSEVLSSDARNIQR